MPNCFVNDKKKNKKKKPMMPLPKKLWINFVSTFQSKLKHLKKSQLTLSNTRHHHHQQHHHHYQTVNNHHHHHYYYYSHDDHHQPKILFLDGDEDNDNEEGFAIAKPSSVDDANGDHDDLGTKRSELVPQNITRNGNITPEIEFFDDYGDDEKENEMESGGNGAIIAAAAAGYGDSDDFTLSKLHLAEVDARAEEFINQRKEVWRLEKQKSEEEYWQMLARCA